MKALKLKPLISSDKNQIFVKPPERVSTARENEKSSWKNCTFCTVEELKDLLKGKRTKRKAIIKEKFEDHDQVEKLNHWRHNSSAQSPRSIAKKYTFRRKLSVTYDLSTITLISTEDFNRDNDVDKYKTPYSIINQERNKNKILKDEYAKITVKNNQIIRNTIHEMDIISSEIERLEASIKHLKENLENIHKEFTEADIKTSNEMKFLQQQKSALLQAAKNIQLKKLFKLGEAHENYLLREKLRQEKQSLTVEIARIKEKFSKMITEKEKEKETLICNKRELKKEQALLKSTLISIYMKILKQGLDLREEGLRWIIKCLWQLDEPIPLSAFPHFFDEESSQFLLSMAQYDIELADNQGRLESTRTKVKEARNQMSISKNNEELLVNVKARLRKLCNSVKASPVKRLDDFTNGGDKVYVHEGNNYVSEIVEIKKNIERINKSMHLLTENEIRRVTNNYKVSPVEVGLAHIFKALLGSRAREYMKLTQI
ncbi:hypothetical protein SteCoe_22847 [Stentor coeruleus]|uniref:Uncharacterized protein n=1 Tax=Stentor coeruleus TaxID=5963 RepID=A0A1R2BL61_9CILI|nr:hypothetical protein SteCoe_22847 [Stentor coeruleus]